MALARIISHSHQYSRELALDLLARGYTVEIVSPDKVSDNAADLELRLEPGGANEPTANIAVRDGTHWKSLDSGKAPMRDFVRRPPQAVGAARFPERTVNFDAGPRLLGEGWFWRAAAGFAVVLALGGALVMGARRTDAASLAQRPGIDLRNIATYANTSSFVVPKPTAISADRKNPTDVTLGRPERASQTASLKAESSQGKARLESSLRRTDDLRVSDAIINRDKAPARVATQNPPQKRRHYYEEEVIAPDTVTYLEGAVTAKAGVQ